MKTIGLLGGMSWQSTLKYYQLINEGVQKALGGLHSGQMMMHSVDFEPIKILQHQDDWDAMTRILVDASLNIEKAGADFLVIATNTMHKLAPQIEEALNIPLLHIADAVAETLKADGIRRVGLLGTNFTMEQPFYKDRLKERHGLDVLIPDSDDRQTVHRIIYNELCAGTISGDSQKAYYQIIDKLAGQGAEAVILGCTEIGLLVNDDESPLTLYDTTDIHAQKAVEFALAS